MDKEQRVHDLAMAVVSKCLSSDEFCSADSVTNEHAKDNVFRQIAEVYQVAYESFAKSLS